MRWQGVHPGLIPLVVAAALSGAALMFALLPRSACSHACPGEEPETPVATFSPTGFARLEGWAGDDHAAALAAFARSCKAIAADPSRFAARPDFGSN